MGTLHLDQPNIAGSGANTSGFFFKPILVYVNSYFFIDLEK